MLQQQRFTPRVPVSGFLPPTLGWPALSEEGPERDAWSKPKGPFLATTVICCATLPVVRVGARGGERKGSKRRSLSRSAASLIA